MDIPQLHVNENKQNIVENIVRYKRLLRESEHEKLLAQTTLLEVKYEHKVELRERDEMITLLKQTVARLEQVLQRSQQVSQFQNSTSMNVHKTQNIIMKSMKKPEKIRRISSPKVAIEKPQKPTVFIEPIMIETKQEPPVSTFITSKPSSPSDNTFHCTHCPLCFKSRSSLTVHTRRHTGERPYVCTLCDKTFSSHNGLRQHRIVHSNEKKYKCSECDMSFRYYPSLKNHRIKTH